MSEKEPYNFIKWQKVTGKKSASMEFSFGKA